MRQQGRAIVGRLIKAGLVDLAAETQEVLSLKRFNLDAVQDVAEKNEGEDLGSRGSWHVFFFKKPRLADLFEKTMDKIIGPAGHLQRMGSNMVGIPDALLVRACKE